MSLSWYTVEEKVLRECCVVINYKVFIVLFIGTV